MAGPLDLRGSVTITDNGATSTLGRIRQGLAAVGQKSGVVGTVGSVGSVASNVYRSIATDVGHLERGIVALRNNLVMSGLAFGGIVAVTRGFNESKFGYGFARITEYIKDGRLDIEGWRAEMDRAALSARAVSRQLGVTPERTMQAREEVQKLGFKEAEAEAIYNSALGLHMSEPDALSTGDAAKYLGAVFRAYAKQREERAQKQGVDPNDRAFVEMAAKELAAKAAVAGAESALGPADIVEGMRQFAPQWASMGVSYETALAALAHGSNYGFRAAEMGTALKSMITKVINPTATALAILNAKGINRSEFFTAAPVEPGKAANRLNSLLGGAITNGKGGKGRLATVREMLDTAYKQGTLTSPEFQEALTQEVLRMLPKGYEGKSDEVLQAVNNATISAQGGVRLPELIKEMRDKQMSVGEIAQVLEGRHVARYTPLFQFYEQFIGLLEKLESTDGTTIDAVKEGRKDSEAGKTDALFAAWQNLMGTMEQSGGIIDIAKTALTGLMNQLADMPAALQGLTMALIGLGAAGAGLAILRGAAGVIGGLLRYAVGLSLAAAPAAAAGSAVTPGAAVAAGAVTGGAIAGGAGAVAGAKAAGKLALRFIPGVGLVLMAFGAAYGAYQEYQEGGDVVAVLREALLGSIGLNGLYESGPGYSPSGTAAQEMPSLTDSGPLPDQPPLGAVLPPLPARRPSAAVSPPLPARRPSDAAAPQSTAMPPPGALDAASSSTAVDTQAASAVASAHSAAQQIRSIFASLNLAAEGRQAMESFASGVRDGTASAVAAANSAAARVKAAAGSGRVNLNTGPAMGAGVP